MLLVLLPMVCVPLGLSLYEGAVERAGVLLLAGIGFLLSVCLVSTKRRALDALSADQRRLAGMSEALDAMVWECDRLGQLTYLSPRVAAHFGYRPADAVRMDIAELVHPRERSRLRALLAAGEGWRSEPWLCLDSEGNEVWFVGSCTPFHDTQGNVMGFSGSSQPLGQEAVVQQQRSDIAVSVSARLATEEIHPVFQPIVSMVTGRLIGAELLSRFPDSTRNPEQWFGDAAEVGLGRELELLAIRLGLAAATTLPADIYVSVNVSPATLADVALRDVLQSAPIAQARVVLELTEHASITDYAPILSALTEFRGLGVRLAVDDAGAGYASFRHILRLTPEFIKLDRSLVAGIHLDAAKRALATAVVGFGAEMGARIVAEGVENLAEYRSMEQIGIDAAQGYLLGRPTADWVTWNEWHASGPVIRPAVAQS